MVILSLCIPNELVLLIGFRHTCSFRVFIFQWRIWKSSYSWYDIMNVFPINLHTDEIPNRFFFQIFVQSMTKMWLIILYFWSTVKASKSFILILSAFSIHTSFPFALRNRIAFHFHENHSHMSSLGAIKVQFRPQNLTTAHSKLHKYATSVKRLKVFLWL